MLIKLHPVTQIFARQKEVAQPKELTRQQRIIYDRIVIITMFLTVIIAAALFS